MAKKKSTHQPKDANHHENPIAVSPETHSKNLAPAPAMDDPAEKLKFLNKMLLKETSERRLQVETLGHEKAALEEELVKSKTALEAELTRAGSEVARLEIENSVFAVFVSAQMGKMESEVEGLRKERALQVGVLEKRVSELVGEVESERSVVKSVGLERDELGRRVREVNGLKEKVVEMEKRERGFGEEIGKLRSERVALMKENEAKERALVKERDLLERSLGEKTKMIEDLRMEIEGVVREKNRIEAEKLEQQRKIVELEKNVANLDEIVSSLKNEEGLLRGKVREMEKRNGEAMLKEKEMVLEKLEQQRKIVELEKNVANLNDVVSRLKKEEVMVQDKVREMEKRNGEAMEKEKEMVMEINALVTEKKKMEASINVLVGEKSSLTQQLEAAKKECEDMDRRLEALVREKNEAEEVKASHEREIASLSREASKLRDNVLGLQDLNLKQEEKNKQLLSEVSRYRDALEKAVLEKESLEKNLLKECEKVIRLNKEVEEMKKRIEENVEELKQMTVKYDGLVEEKSKIEICVASLVKEKASLEKKLSDAEQCIDGMRLKVESASSSSERALALLKNTAAMVSQSNGNRNGKEEMGFDEEKLQGEIEPHLAELNAIKKAFSNKEKVVEDLNRKLESLCNSVEAHKKKNFWTLVSSATTIFAALSIAYAARAH